MTAFCNSKHKLVCSLQSKKETKPSFSDSRKKYILSGREGYNVCYLKYDETEYERTEGHNRAVDYIILTCIKPDQKPKMAILVELKGTNVSSAMEQIIDTLERENNSILSEYVVLARIVCRSAVSLKLNQSLSAKLHSVLRKHNKTVGYSRKAQLEKILFKIESSIKNSPVEKLSDCYAALLK